MEWADHDRWAAKLGVDKAISREVNTIIDAVASGDLIPKEYKRHLQSCADEWAEDNAPNSKSAFTMVVSDYSARKHDSERSSKTGGDIAADVHRCAMQRMGDDYLMAWYLHHHLDYLSENRGSSTDLGQLVADYKSEHPKTHSPEIEAFLLNHAQELETDLGIGSNTDPS